MSGLEKYRWDAHNCIHCSNCMWVDHVYLRSHRYSTICPSSVRYVFDAYTGKGRFDAALGVLNKELNFTPKLLDIIYRCSMGGGCDAMCKRNLDLELIETFQELRAECYRQGKTLPQHDAMVASIKDKDNPWDVPREQKYRWLEGVKAKDITREKAEVLFFAGCSPKDDRLLSVPRDSLALLQQAGLDVGILGRQEKCCGFSAWEVGEREVSVNLIRENIETFNRLGISTLVTSCAMCFGALVATYPAYGQFNFKVLHISQMLEQLIKEGKLKLTKPINMKVTYQDPCHLGRLGEPYVRWEGTRGPFGRQIPPKELRRGTYGVYDPPRNVLKAIPGINLVEMERFKENAWCCGSGGGVKTAYPDFALWTAQERLEEMLETGAEALVTACPNCEANFRDSIEEAGANIKVYDIVELVRQAL
ncbi:MAG: heterodisulfide reductase-related iron-sulfur binding cluster [Chloroflexota bacterium]